MKNTITILLFLILSVIGLKSHSQDTKYAYGVIHGTAMIYGEFNSFWYFTEIDEINCFISKSNAENQLQNKLKSVGSRWDDPEYIVNIFSSYDEAQRFKNNNIQKVRSTRRLRTSIVAKNDPINFKCSD
ncbi:MAG: hypothetical protein COA67_00415 [Lutibacter sp.]|nr:MAG: hypothetical protein COA67_00415 [Lutibacter sp.]